MRTVVIKTYFSSVDANFDKHKLENEGINCFISGENFNDLLPHMSRMTNGGVKIRVNEKDLDKAKEILFPYSKACPKCDSKDIRYENPKLSFSYFFIILLQLITFTPIFAKESTWNCNSCNHQF